MYQLLHIGIGTQAPSLFSRTEDVNLIKCCRKGSLIFWAFCKQTNIGLNGAVVWDYFPQRINTRL